jgi:hypothetical protein
VASSVLEQIFTAPAFGGQFGLGGVLRLGNTFEGEGPAFVAAPGTYSLFLTVTPEGFCSGSPRVNGASLTYRLVAG